MITAEVIQFPVSQPEPEPVSGGKVADCDNGYTRIANEILDELLLADLTARQIKTVLAVIRKTYGFNKKSDRVANTQIGEMTRIHHTHICKAKKELLARKILVSSANQIGVNKTLSDWELDISQVSQTLANSANNSLADPANNSLAKSANHKRQKTKDNNNTNGTSARADAPTSTTPEKPEANPTTAQTKPRTNYDVVLETYHRILPEMKSVKELTDARKKKIRDFFSKYKFNLADWEGYLTHISQHCRWMLEARPRNRGANDESKWKVKTFDFLLTERCYLGVLEGNYDDC